MTTYLLTFDNEILYCNKKCCGTMNYDIVIVSDSIAIIFSYVLMMSIIIYHAVFLIV